MKKLWIKFKAWATSIWNTIKTWWNTTALPWLQKSWMQIVNVIVIFFIYSKLYGAGLVFASVIIALWLLTLIGYYLYKFFIK